MGPVDFTIREFRRSDFLRLWEIDQQCFQPGISYSQQELLSYMRRPRAFTMVAERDGEGPVLSGAAPPAPHAVGFIVAEGERKHSGPIITIEVVE